MEEAFAPPVSVVPVVSPARSPFDGLRRFSRWFYTQNPLYLLSAWLVFFGLRSSFGPGTALESSAALFAGLLSYTLLLALASIVVVRYARVWDDARSMLLLVMLLFVGASVALDETLVTRPGLGRWYYLIAWAIAAICCEVMLRAIRLQLPGWYRCCFHALLALFFGYPVLLTPWVQNPSDPRLHWLLFLFTTCAAMCFALLWPAVRRGAEYVRDNGSPWPWPLYPWSLFVILALCVAGRAYYLCVSFHFVAQGATIFGPYFLLPLCWCLSGLWLTGAVRAQRHGVARALLLAPIVWSVLAAVHRPDQVYVSFLHEVVDTLHASPLFLNLLVSLAYYTYARRHGVDGAELGQAVTLAACSIVAPTSLAFGEVTHVLAWPWLVMAAALAYFAWREHSELRWLLAGACCIVAIDRLVDVVAPAPRFLVTYQLALLAVLALGYLGRGELARWLRQNAGPAMLLLALLALWRRDMLIADLSPAYRAAYVAALAATSLGYAWLLRLRVYVLTSLAMIAAAGATSAWPWFAQARRSAPGLDHIFVGLASLVLGLAVSFAKAGYWDRWTCRWRFPPRDDSAVPAEAPQRLA